MCWSMQMAPVFRTLLTRLLFIRRCCPRCRDQDYNGTSQDSKIMEPSESRTAPWFGMAAETEAGTQMAARATGRVARPMAIIEARFSTTALPLQPRLLLL